ncbi:MAG: hypothetical protein U5K43_00870 [Halofilum sp. (in: g-proteobacteria)]|nr:hypothetical protein [Halofilum sp. (in: g-proteobacteria)]
MHDDESPRTPTPWHARPAEAVLEALGVDAAGVADSLLVQGEKVLHARLRRRGGARLAAP